MCIVTDATFSFCPRNAYFYLVKIISRMNESLGKRTIKIIKIFGTSGVAIIIIVIIIVVVIMIIIIIIIIIFCAQSGASIGLNVCKWAGESRFPSRGLFRPWLKTFVAPFLPTQLTAPGSPGMVLPL